jgi:hypothetical protein
MPAEEFKRAIPEGWRVLFLLIKEIIDKKSLDNSEQTL